MHKFSHLLIDNDDEVYNLEYMDTNTDNVLNTLDIEDDEKSKYIIRNECLREDDQILSEFLQFCLTKGLFDNTFYDTHNAFSVVATKLPKTFDKLSGNKDNIKKKT